MTANRLLYIHLHQLPKYDSDESRRAIDELIAKCEGKVDALAGEHLSWPGHWGISGKH